MKKILKTSWWYIRRSPYQALAAVAIITLTLFASSVFILLAVGSEKVLAYFEKKPQVIAFLKDEAEKEEIDSLTLELLSTKKVADVKFVSKEEALEIYKEQNKENPLLLEMVSAEILPASLEISSKGIGYLGEIADLLSEESIVEEVSFQRDVVEVLQQITRGIRRGGAILVGFLLLVSLLVVLIIVGMKAAARHREIKIVQLLGASFWYIRSPFLLEGTFYGVVSALLAWGFTYLLLLYTTPYLSAFLAGVSLFPVPFTFMLILLGGLMLGGVLIGSLGSLIAVWRYLH
jgi:cell division transport system permease protein